MRSSRIVALASMTLVATSTAFTTTASADFEYFAQIDAYSVTAADFDGSDVTVNVQDIYMVTSDSTDTLLNVFNWNSAATGATSYFQSFTGTGWTPTNLGGPFDTAALQQADSFVTIGGFGADALQAPGAGGGTGLDPNFGGNSNPAPGVNAGWFNSNPPSLNGQAMTYDNGITGTLIGRFTSAEDFTLAGTMFQATWNNGLGTDGDQANFEVAPAPGALALLALAGIGARRRRG